MQGSAYRVDLIYGVLKGTITRSWIPVGRNGVTLVGDEGCS